MATSPNPIFFRAVLVIWLLGLSACSPPQKPTSKKTSTASPKSESPYGDMGGPKPREEKAEPAPGPASPSQNYENLAAFGNAYAGAMTEGDDRVAQASWNLDTLLDLALAGSAEQLPEIVKEIKQGAIDSLAEKPGGVLWASFGKPCRMLRVHEAKGETRILFRVASEEGLGYYDLIPKTGEDGAPVIIDMYSYGAGEKLTETFRRLVLPQIAEAAKTPLRKLFTTHDPQAIQLEQIKELSQSVQSGNFARTLEVFRSFPPDVQQEKTVLLIYLRAAAKLMAGEENPEAEKAYQDGVSRFEELFGDNDPAFLLMGIDYYFFQEDFEAAEEAIDKLDEALGGDPYLDFFRASAMMSQEKYEEALPLAQKALENDPEIEDPYWGIVNIQLALGDFEAVAEGLDQLVEHFDYEFELKDDPAYDEFRLSNAGKAWIEKHEAQ